MFAKQLIVNDIIPLKTSDSGPMHLIGWKRIEFRICPLLMTWSFWV